MAYFAEFRTQLQTRNFTKFLELWQEYVASDIVDIKEILDILRLVKSSDYVKLFGPHVEAIFPLIDLVQSQQEKLAVYQLVFDLQTSNSPMLFELAMNLIKEHFPEASLLNEKLRLVGLRMGDNFQGCLSNFVLLSHLEKGNFVLHT